MLKLVKPSLEHKNKYKEMISEWQKYGGPYVPCIVEYDCGNSVDELDYEAVLKVVDDYSKGNVFDYDVDYFESSDFYFIFDDNDLIGMGEVRHNLKPLGNKTIGHIACGIRPSKRKQGYALKATECMLEKLKEDGIEEAIVCHYSENDISPKIIKKLDFKYRNSVVSEVSKKEIKCYTKKLKWYVYKERDEKNVIITGGASGIGLATAKKLAKDNKVIIADYKDINQDFIKNNFDNFENVYFFKCDISKKDDILNLKQYILDNFGKLDCLVCCAGIMPLPCEIDTITDENIDRTIDVNLKGTFKCLNILGNLIKETSTTGSIVNISSVDGLIGEPYGVIYSTTKAGIISLTKSFARYFKGDIRVNCVAPGLIDTPLTDSTGEDPSWTTDYSIIKRIGKPEEIADSILFLLSDQASYITGQVLTVDGGFTLK